MEIGNGGSTRVSSSGFWVDCEIVDGQMVRGTYYTNEEWDRKLMWERIEAMDKKLDAILALLQTR